MVIGLQARVRVRVRVRDRDRDRVSLRLLKYMVIGLQVVAMCTTS